DIARLVLVQQFAQHRHEDVHSVGRLSFRVAQQAAFGSADRRMIRAVHLRAAVDQIQEGLVGHQDGRNFYYIIGRMRFRAGVLLVAALSVSCGGGGGLFRQYEYEEEMYLSLDGSATIYVNSSVAALNALRGTSFDSDPSAPVDRAAVRDYFTTPVTRVTRRPV